MFIVNILNITKREFVRIVKDRNLLLVFLLAPLMYPAFYGSVYVKKIENDVPVAVMDDDNSSLSRALVRSLDAHQYIRIAMAVHSEEEMKDVMARGKVQGAIWIHKNFSRSLKYGREVPVNLFLSPGRLIVLSDVGIAASEVAANFGGKITASYLAKRGVPVFSDPGYAQPLHFDFRIMNNSYLAYGDMLLPGLLIIVMSQLVLIATAASTAREWTDRSWNELHTTAGGSLPALCGKMLAYLSIFLLIGSISTCALIPVLDINVIARGTDLFFLTLVGVMASAALGMFIGSFFHHRITVFAVLGFTSYPFFLMTGYAWPVQQIPAGIKILSYALPLTPYAQAGQRIMQEGLRLSGMTQQLINFAVLIVIYSLLFMIRTRYLAGKERKRNMEILETAA